MKTKTRTIVALLAACACWGVPRSQAIPLITLDVLDPEIWVGEAFSVEVWARNAVVSGEELLAFGFEVVAPSVATYLGFDTGPLFTPTSGAGTYVSDLAFPGIDVSEVLLATLHFSATIAGTGILNASGAYDGLSYGLFYSTSGFNLEGTANITVHSAIPPVPDTSSLLVTAVTFLGLLGLGRWKALTR